ncbi:Crp/Fnr family transcriptional regulator [Brumimicrobium aurantiacum]|uniref:Crp/Fnr family transcriptional regulator n=1 Tax=Brumimicrobium aurantiacum TaxID=1737063 RepID=A0A3E1F1R7_9FLAO|nr:Crp/Fnr family transcriptional regulator [Brumimicrobium aurantiacum]RFC55693.1 Crp/Fnr family transcriptional regulator [Brumimicrobium aurantiacum]
MDIINQFRNTFEPQLLEKMKEVGSELEIKAGDVILDYGEIVRNMPIIAKGTIKVSRLDEDGKEILLYYVNSKESCAMTFTCCMEQFPSEIKAVAEEDVEMLTIPIKFMDEWLMTYSTWKSFVMGTIRGRFNEMLNTIDQIAFQKLDERLKHYLQQKAKLSNSKLLNLSHEEIARDLATSRVVISRLLKKLENEDLLLLYRNQIKLLSSFEIE